MQSLAFAMAIDDRLAMLRAMERASGMSLSKLTTLLTRPAECASAAVSLCKQAQLHEQWWLERALNLSVALSACASSSQGGLSPLHLAQEEHHQCKI